MGKKSNKVHAKRARKPRTSANARIKTRKNMTPSYDIVDQKISQIEAEMRRIGIWQAKPPPAEALVITQAFGGDKLAFEQWLQFVFIPRVRQIIAQRGQFPAKSQVAGQAFREWKMWGNEPNVDRLLELLREFDGMFGKADE